MATQTARSRLSTRLGITHGALVALLGLLLVVTQQGLIRMLDLITDISDDGFSSLDAEEELHRSAWDVEVAVRHGRAACATADGEAMTRERIARARARFREVFAKSATLAPLRLRLAAEQYGSLADDALSGETCEWLSDPAADAKRLALDEEMTNAWIDRLHELHADIEAKEERARTIGGATRTAGLAVAAFGAITALAIAWWTAQSISRPVARLAADATRLGEGGFEPIAPVEGPVEIQELQSNLERARVRLHEIDRVKQAFLATVSHELRSPLGRLREALALLGDGTLGALSDRQARVLTIARRACEREVRIVDALLDMSRLSSGLPAKLEAGCDLGRVIDAAVEEERAEATERDVEIVVEHAESLPTIEADSALVERAVANLVRNAVSVSEKGAVVRVTSEVIGDRRGLRVRVSDDGPGLGAEIQKTLFQPFASAAVPGRARAAGIGLGLSFAREVARAHGGDLTVASTGDRGTTFHLDLAVEPERKA